MAGRSLACYGAVMTDERVRCCATWMKDYHRQQCSRWATVHEGGKPYCSQHNPVRVAAARAERRARWDAEYAERDRAAQAEKTEREIGRLVLEHVAASGERDLPA